MKNYKTIILLCLIAIVGVFTLDVYLPSIPAMAKEFDVTTDKISFTFAIFSIVFGVSQLFYGIISDYIGRKPILLGGLIVAAIATMLCITAKSYESLLTVRIFQALGISVFVVVNAIIRDLYTGTTAVQIRILVTTVSGISISIAPTIGGLLQSQYDWQGGFMASLLLILITFIYAGLFFSESKISKQKSTLNFFLIVRSYCHLFSNTDYTINVFIATFAYSIHFSFIIMSAKIFMNLLGFSAINFGYLMFVYGGVYFLSGFLSAHIAKKISITQLIQLGATCIMLSGMTMFLLSLFITLNTWQILIPASLMTIGITMVRSAATTGALAPLSTQSGQGAAGLNLVQFILSAIIATGINEIGNQPQDTFAYLALICGSLIIFLIHFRSVNRLIKLA